MDPEKCKGDGDDMDEASGWVQGTDSRFGEKTESAAQGLGSVAVTSHTWLIPPDERPSRILAGSEEGEPASYEEYLWPTWGSSRGRRRVGPAQEPGGGLGPVGGKAPVGEGGVWSL